MDRALRNLTKEDQRPFIPKSCRIAETVRLHPNVRLGENVVIDDFCVIGYPPQGYAPGDLETVIGDGTVVRTRAVIYAGFMFGRSCHVSHNVVVREFCLIGDRVSIGTNTLVEHHCQIGDNTRIQGLSGLAEYTIIEDGAWIGPAVVTTNVLHPTCTRAKECLHGPIIRSGAIVGAHTVIMPDIEVGERSLLGSGSVIIKSVRDEAVMFGVPARKIANVEQMHCPYDMLEGHGPYGTPRFEREARTPLVDLGKEYQDHKQEYRLALDRVVLNARFVNGKEVAQFEHRFAETCQTGHAIAVDSGFKALWIALVALGIGHGDEVMMTAWPDESAVEAVTLVGGRPVFVDLDPQSLTIDPRRIAERITPRTKAIIASHTFGLPAAMPEITALAECHGLAVIEDASEAPGAVVEGELVGAWGTCAIFSFDPENPLGAYGAAGAVVTRDPALARLIDELRERGRLGVFPSGARLDTIQAAILAAKLEHLPGQTTRRQQAADYYRQHLDSLPIALPQPIDGREHVYAQFVVRTSERSRLHRHLDACGVASHFPDAGPLHLRPAYAHLGCARGSLPVTEQVSHESLSLPIRPELTPKQGEMIVAAVQTFFR